MPALLLASEVQIIEVGLYVALNVKHCRVRLFGRNLGTFVAFPHVTFLIPIGTQLHGWDSQAGLAISWYLTCSWNSHAGAGLVTS